MKMLRDLAQSPGSAPPHCFPQKFTHLHPFPTGNPVPQGLPAPRRALARMLGFRRRSGRLAKIHEVKNTVTWNKCSYINNKACAVIPCGAYKFPFILVKSEDLSHVCTARNAGAGNEWNVSIFSETPCHIFDWVWTVGRAVLVIKWLSWTQNDKDKDTARNWKRSKSLSRKII